jgi:N-methylhydantoinase A
MELKLGIDVGGTFTDVTLFDMKTGELYFKKVPSTPESPSTSMANGISIILEETHNKPEKVGSIVHGTTLATNALIQRKGSSVALLGTQGFRDVLHIGRQVRPNMNNWFVQRPAPLIPRHLRYDVSERVLYTGEIEKEVDEDGLSEIIQDLKKNKVVSVAVCFLHSYINPKNELAVRSILQREMPGLKISLSCEILPEFREYERMSTTAINAYVQPLMEDYLVGLRKDLSRVGMKGNLHIMQSNGGVMTLETAKSKSAYTILSGPAAGVLGGLQIAIQSGFSNVITADMGGTSFDISLIDRGKFTTGKENEINGLPIKVPMIDIITIGAGGGSIAWIDEGSGLRVGPQSAGASPGPTCYKKGGEEPTVTDANLILGRLNPSYFLGGEMQVYPDLSARIMGKKIAEPLGLSIEKAAEGIIRVINASMVRGIRRVSVERGFDPRNFVLECFGGAGPLHAVELARELRIPKVIIPIRPGFNSAIGLLIADMRYDFIKTYIKKFNQSSLEEINRYYQDMERAALEKLQGEITAEGEILVVRSADVRYFGQGHELEVSVANKSLTEKDLKSLRSKYNESHRIRFGYDIRSYELEFVNLRLAVVGKLKKPKFRKMKQTKNVIVQKAIKGQRKVFLNGKWQSITIYDRSYLVPGNRLKGPCIVEQMDSTTLLNEWDRGILDEHRNIIIDIGVKSHEKIKS